jgi:putative hydrolase of the HAD superfamily
MQGAEPSPIDLVIFDLDDVLAALDRPRRLRWLAAATGKAPEHFNATIWHADFEPAAEAGAYPTGAEYLAEFNRRSGCALTREQWVQARRQAMTVDPEVLAIARELSARGRIALLTNNGALLKESLAELVPEVAALFGDGGHASCEFRARKPDPAVYARLVAQAGVLPARALMIDDDPGNVQGARDAGLQGLRFLGPARLRADLAALGLCAPAAADGPVPNLPGGVDQGLVR